MKLKIERYKGKVYFPLRQRYSRTITFFRNTHEDEPSGEVEIPQWLYDLIERERSEGVEQGKEDMRSSIRNLIGAKAR